MRIDPQALSAVRAQEVAQVIALFHTGDAILEIGGGNGWQAREIASRGFHIESIDLAGGPYESSKVWPVRSYDGETLPFDADTFDVIFSSNVLEHIPDLDRLLAETARVTRRGGRAIHLMPTPTWRMATFLTHYPWLASAAVGLLLGKASQAGAATSQSDTASRSLVSQAIRALYPRRHGEAGTALAELQLFSPQTWRARLSKHGWRLVDDSPMQLFYSGYFVLYPYLGIEARRRLARVLGSSCHLYQLERV